MRSETLRPLVPLGRSVAGMFESESEPLVPHPSGRSAPDCLMSSASRALAWGARHVCSQACELSDVMTSAAAASEGSTATTEEYPFDVVSNEFEEIAARYGEDSSGLHASSTARVTSRGAVIA